MAAGVQRLFGALILSLIAAAAGAQDRHLHIAAPEALVETGFLKHLLPRFSLKNGVPITVVAPGETADARFDPTEGRAVFAGDGVTWHINVAPEAGDNVHMAKLLDWLASDVGAQAMASFAGPPAFTIAAVAEEPETARALTGDLVRGAELSLVHCGRCHVIGPQNRMNGVGSTPSFAVLRALGDWQVRFTDFYALNPHPAFTQVAEVTAPFAEGRAPTTSPVRLTLAELDDIIAYAASVAPADLGAPIQHQ